MNKRRKLIIGIIGLLFACCGLAAIGIWFREPDTAVSATTTPAQIAQTISPQPPAAQTAVPTAANTPAATATATSTNTPTVTPTPSPTNTPRPTTTPTMLPTPTATPTPIVLTGSGDAVVDVDRPGNPSLIHIAGNAGSRHFAVASYGDNGEYLNLLVNSSDPYDGVRPLDFLQGEHAVRFEVNAAGNWTIEILPLTTVRRLTLPGAISGKGDDVVALVNGQPDLATISGNDQGRHFAVIGYGSSRPELLINTADPYEGTVILSPDTFLLEITAVGTWEMAVTRR